jgi:hypothetical protein
MTLKCVPFFSTTFVWNVSDKCLVRYTEKHVVGRHVRLRKNHPMVFRIHMCGQTAWTNFMGTPRFCDHVCFIDVYECGQLQNTCHTISCVHSLGIFSESPLHTVIRLPLYILSDWNEIISGRFVAPQTWKSYTASHVHRMFWHWCLELWTRVALLKVRYRKVLCYVMETTSLPRDLICSWQMHSRKHSRGSVHCFGKILLFSFNFISGSAHFHCKLLIKCFMVWILKLLGSRPGASSIMDNRITVKIELERIWKEEVMAWS